MWRPAGPRTGPVPAFLLMKLQFIKAEDKLLIMWEWGASCSMGDFSVFSEPTSRGTAAGRAR